MQDFITVLLLILMEGLLSFDNSLALAAMVKNLPPVQQRKALTYGMAGAFFFRFVALFFVTTLLANPWIKAVGGVYLLLLAGNHFIGPEVEQGEPKLLNASSFLKVLVMVELTDLSFSVDSILAAAGLSQKLEIVFIGGVLGIIMMRFMATVFIKLIARFPNLERTAYLLIGIVGTKLVLEARNVHPSATLTWCLMAVAIATGFMPSKVLAS